jgi:RNA polymerase sigma factor (sigma-70 family)
MAVNPVLDFLRRFRTSDQVRKTPDAELLARFVASRDEAAFTALVQRHGPMVLRLCVRVLGNSPDAEDAFQATFLVLARRASSVSRPELLGNWLYGVAHRTALKVRANTTRRQTFRREGGPVDGSDPAIEASHRELRRMLDQELSRLPDRYRVPLVLHYLEGRTQEEVAHLLGCPRNTIATRLARACERLRGRLARSGVALSSGSLAEALAEEASAALPTTLLDATVKAAMLFVAGGSALPSTVALVAEGVIQAMFITKVKVVFACVVLLSAVATGAGVLERQAGNLSATAHAQEFTTKIDPNQDSQEKQGKLQSPKGESWVGQAEANKLKEMLDNPDLFGIDHEQRKLSEARVKRLVAELRPGDRISQLVKEQYEAARAEADCRLLEYLAGKTWGGGAGDVTRMLYNYVGASQRLLQAELDLSRKAEDYVAALKAQIQRMQEVEVISTAKYNAGQNPITDIALARFSRSRAEIWLEQFKKAGKLPNDSRGLH